MQQRISDTSLFSLKRKDKAMTKPNRRFGIWNDVQKRFVFGINEESANRARRELQRKIGKDAYKWRYEVRVIPQNWHNPENPNYKNQKGNRR
jgi:hypothetical protein